MRIGLTTATGGDWSYGGLPSDAERVSAEGSGVPLCEPGREFRTHLRVVLTQIDRGLEKPEFAAAVVACALVTVSQHLLFAQQLRDHLGSVEIDTT